MIEEENIITASEGKVFVHNLYKILFGKKLILGKCIDEEGNEVADCIDNYKEIDIPENHKLGGMWDIFRRTLK